MRLMMTFLLALLVIAPAYSKSFTLKQAYTICRENNTTMLKRLVASGYDVNSKIYLKEKNKYKRLLTFSLHYSNIHTENYKIPIWLIKNSADVNAMGNEDLHPLILASRLKNTYVAWIMLKNGADVNGKMTNQTTRPLHTAVNTGNAKMLRLLLRYQPDINAKDSNGDAPLHVASKNNYPDIARLLLLRGASVDIKGGDGQTPLHDAARMVNIEMIKVLLSYGASAYQKNKYNKRPFNKIFLNDESILRRILADSFLHSYFSDNGYYGKRYRRNIKKLKVAGGNYNFRKPEKKKRKLTKREVRRRKMRTINLVKDLTLAPLWLGTSIFLREMTYKSNLQNNHFGTVNAMIATTSIGFVTGGLIGYGLGLLFDRIPGKRRDSMSTVIGSMIMTGIITGVIGGYLGYRYRNEFKSDKAIYYGTASLISISIVAIRF